MAIESQERKESTHVRVSTEKKKRVAKVVAKVYLDTDKKMNQEDLVDEILEEGLTKRERKLGIQS